MAVAGLVPAASAVSAEPAAAEVRDYASLVNVFVGTEGDFGNDMPAAQAPNGLAKINPRTMPGRNNTGYDYAQSQISGFTHTNLDGVGGSGGGGDILVVPTSGTYTSRPGAGTYAHSFSHDQEEASPGYYGVSLGNITGVDDDIKEVPGTIEAEVTATTRSGVHRYAFPEGSDPSLVLDLSTNNTSRIASSLDVERLEDGRAAMSGEFIGHFYNASYTMYYYAETTQPVTEVQTWGDDRALTDAAVQDGRDTGAIFTFDRADADDIGLEVTVSPVSAAQAEIDQHNELGDMGFDEVHERTRAEWNHKLGKVDVTASVATDPSGETEQLFYTHLYRMFAMPMNATSTSGTYKGVDGATHRAQGFTYYDSWATWDDFRKFSVLAYIDPEMYRDMVQSMVYLFADAEAEGSGRGLGGLMHTVPTVRWERSAVVIADATAKGYTGLDRLDEAYPALERLVGGYSDADRDRGFIPDNPGSSVQLGYDQWGLSIIADELGMSGEAANLRDLAALPIENLVKPGAWTANDGTEVGLLTPRNGAGEWQDVDYERFEAARLYQGTLWQYHWYDAYDMDALVSAMGGDDAALLALRHMFGEHAPDDGSAMLHSNANEIDLQAPYLFNYVGDPSLTQKWTRAIYTKETWNRYIGTGSTSAVPSGGGEFTPPIKTHVYKLEPRGMLATMDNDAGTMSTMFVAAAIGLFPVTAGSSEYQIGSPFFDSAVISYDDGASFEVTANGVSEDDFYIQSAALNGGGFDNTWVDYSTIVGGGDLAFQMGDVPSDWGTDTAPAYSMSTVADGGETDGYRVSADPLTVQVTAEGDVNGEIELTLAGGATFAPATGTDLVGSADATVEGLPTTVDAAVVVESATRATVSVTGAASADARFYVALRDSALADGVRASALEGQGISLRSPLRLSVAAVERAALQALVDDAVLVRQGNYSTSSFGRFTAAVDGAQELLENASASSVDLRFATDTLQSAIDGLELDKGGYRVLQGEESEAWSGGELKNEANSSSGNLGGVRSGSWIQYQDMDFRDADPGFVTVRYATSFGSGDEPSTLVVHAGDADGPVIETVDLTGTGGWGNYQEITAAVDDAQALVDAEVVTFEFLAPAGRSWVANFDWFQFSIDDPNGAPGPGPLAGVTIEAEDWIDNSGGALKNEGSTWGSGPVTNLGGTADGDWLSYGAVDFGELPLGELSVHYVHNSGRCGNDSALEVYLDDFDPANPGEPFTTVPLTSTGSSWSSDGVATVTLPDNVDGSHEVFVRLTTEAYDGHPYVANIDSMTFTPGAPSEVVIESEDWVDNSGGGLKNEGSTWASGPVTNIGGTADGDWLSYGEIDFGSGALDELAVHYVHNSGRCGNNSVLELYLDEFDPANPGEPFVTVSLPSTGSNWSTDAIAAVDLPGHVRGTHEVFVRLTTEAYANHPFVANIDNMTFSTDVFEVEEPTVDTTALAAAIAEVEHLEDEADRYGRIDFQVFTDELAAARSMLASSSATQAQVDEQARRLTLAAEQLVPAERLRLENLITGAEDIAAESFTDESWESFTAELAAAILVRDDQSATDAALLEVRESLQRAIDALEEIPTAPDMPAELSVSVEGSSVRVTWAPPADDGGSAITGYIVELDDGRRVHLEDPSQTDVVFSWLAPGSSYSANLTAINAVGESEPTAGSAPVTVGEASPGTLDEETDAANDAALRAIEVAGVRIDGFDPSVRSYVVDWPEQYEAPEIAAITRHDEADVELSTGINGLSLAGGGGGEPAMVRGVISGTAEATITVTSADGQSTLEYLVVLTPTADDHLPSTVDVGGDGDDGDDGGDGGSDGDGSGGGSGPGADGDAGSGSEVPAGGGGELSTTGPAGFAPWLLAALFLVALGAGLLHGGRRRLTTRN